MHSHRRAMKFDEPCGAGPGGIVATVGELNDASRYAEALALIDRSLEQSPRDAALLLARGTTLYEWGRIIEARETYMRAQALGARTADLSLKIGWCCAATGMHRESVQWMASAVATDPDSVEARFGLATVLSNVGQTQESQRQLEFVLAREPRHYQALIQLGEQKLASKDFAGAENLFRNAIAAEPRNPVGWLTLTTVLDRQGRSDEAAEAVENAQRLEVETGVDIENFISLAVVKSDGGRFDEALKIFEANLSEKPSPSAHIAYAFVLLRLGLLREGWDHYEFRLMQPNRLADRPRYGKPPWTGQDPQGQTIVLRREQGFGDAIQFVRYAPMLKALGATVWLQIGAGMSDLAKGFAGVDRVFADGDALPDFDYYIHLPSLPRLFGTDVQTIPSHVPYLRPSDEHLAKWKVRLGEVSALKVGLVWAGHPNHLRDWERSIALKMLKPLAEVEGVRLLSLQKGDASADLVSSSEFPIEDLSRDLGDFSDTAAAIQQMDLVISVDTAVAHLAGAMAKPVWLLLPKVCDFRWLESRTDSPWYPTMRLFRQERRGEWKDVVLRASKALKSLVEGGGEPMQAPGRSPMGRAGMAEPRPTPCPRPAAAAPYSALTDTRFGLLQYWPQEDLVGDSLRWQGECLQSILDALMSLIRTGATILETDAGVGFHALALANAVGPGGHVIAYEDRPLHRRLLAQNVAANQVRNITIMRRRIADALEYLDAVETVDQLGLERLDILKINRADHATQVVAGASDTIWRLRPLLIVAGLRGDGIQSAVGIARDFGYRSFFRDVPWFNPQNFNRRSEDVFGDRTDTVLLGVPEEREGFASPQGYRDIS